MIAPSACSSRRRFLRRHRRRLKKLATLALYTLGMHLGGVHGFDYGLHQLPRSCRARADGASRRGCRRASWLNPQERQARATWERYVVGPNGFGTEVVETTSAGDARKRGRSGRGGHGEGGKRRGRSASDRQPQQQQQQHRQRDDGGYAKREILLAQMKVPKTRRQGLVSMWESDLRLRAHEYSALLTAACQLGWTAMASTIMEEMVEDGFPLDAKTYGQAIKAACRADNVRLALLLIMDQYVRWQEGAFAEQKEASATSGSGVSLPRSRGAMRMSDIKQHFPKVLAVTMRTGDMEGSLETLKYMSAMGVEATPGICQILLSTAFKAGGDHVRRVPAILRAMGEMNVTPDTSLLEVLKMLYEADSPESALDLLLEVSRGDGSTGLTKCWWPVNCGPEAFAFLMKHSQKVGRLDVVSMAIHALLTDLPRALYENTPPAELAVDGGVIISNKGAQGSSKIISKVALVEEDSGGINGSEQPVTSGDGRANKVGDFDGTEASPTGKSEKTGVDGLRFRDLEKIQEARKASTVLDSMLAVLTKSSSGHTAAALLDQWRAITLGGVLVEGGGVETEAGTGGDDFAEDARTLARYGKPTEASYSLTMAALVRSGQWGRARSLLEVMRADGVRPSTECFSTLLTLLLERVEPAPTTRAPTAPGGSSIDAHNSAPFPYDSYLWAEPTYDWEEVVSLVGDARNAEGVTVSPEMYLTALSVLPPIAGRPKPTGLGVASSAPPPPARIFLEKAERLLDWAREDGVAMTATLLYPVVLLAHVARDASKVLENFERMLEIDVPHNSSLPLYADAYKMALDACAFGKDPERALSYVHGMRSRSNLEPGAPHYEKAVSAMAAAGRFRDAYQLLAAAVEAGSASVEVYDAAIKAAALEGNSGQAETILRVMVDMGVTPGSETISQVILTYGACGDVDGLCSVMDRATSRAFPGSVLNALVYETLLRMLIPLEAWQEAEAFVKEAEQLLPGSLTYRTYGYLMVAYAVESQWGAAIDLATGIGRWPESSTDPGGRAHPPELRETACAVALEWLLGPRMDAEVGASVSGVDGEEEGDIGGEGTGVLGEGLAERALRYRSCGRELFVRLLAAGGLGPLNSVRVIEAALGALGGVGLEEEEGADSRPSSATAQGSKSFPTIQLWRDVEDGFSGKEATSMSGRGPGFPDDWLVSSLPKDDAEREMSAQALHVSTVLEVLLRAYATCDQSAVSGFHSPAGVGLLQQGISAACAADDPDLAERLFEAWLRRANIDQPWNTRLRTELRVSLSEVLAGFFAEGGGKQGVFRGLALIGRCRDTGLSPDPRDLLAAMRACNAAGLFSLALKLFDELSDATDPDAARSESAGVPGTPDSEIQIESSARDKESRHREGTAAGRRESGKGGKSLAEKEEDTDGEDVMRALAAGMAGERGPSMEGLRQDIPDGELLPAAAATVALESCFLGGNRDRTMSIVWQLIRRRHPLTESCRNRAIVALTEGGKPDMALSMARGMEIDGHYTDRATLEFVEKFQERAFEAAAAEKLKTADATGAAAVGDNICNPSEELLEEDRRCREQGGVAIDLVVDEEEQELDGAWVGDGFSDVSNNAVAAEIAAEHGKGGHQDGDGQGKTFGLVGVVEEAQVAEEEGEEEGYDTLECEAAEGMGAAATDIAASGKVEEDRRPPEFMLRFLPLLSEALRNRLRPEEDAANVGGAVNRRGDTCTRGEDSCQGDSGQLGGG